MKIDLATLAPGKYIPSPAHATLIKVLPAPPKPPRKRPGIIEFETTIQVRRDFRKGLSYAALAKKHRISIPSVRRCLRGDLYVSMIAEAEGLEPTLAAVCLVGLRSHLAPKNPRKNLSDYYSRQSNDEYVPLTPEFKRARHAEQTRRRRARLKAEALAAQHTPGRE